MRSLITALILLLAADPTAAQPVLNVGLRAQPGGAVVLSLGNLDGATLTPSAVATLGFLVRWSKGSTELPGEVPLIAGGAGVRTSVTLYQLQLPASGLQVLRDTGLAAQVRVVKCKLKGPTPLTCPLTVELTRQAELDDWRVTGVTVP